MKKNLIAFDYAIKTVLREKANFGVSSGFLSELLNKKVVVQEILKSESNKNDENLKTNRIDLKAEKTRGDIYGLDKGNIFVTLALHELALGVMLILIVWVIQSIGKFFFGW